MDIAAERQAVINEAKSWIGTPYHHAGQVKGAGVDCLTLLACVYAAAGVIEAITIPHYSQSWHLHRSDELYLGGLLRYCAEVDQTEPGDVALWKFGRCFSHGAIVVDWPLVLHAYVGRRVNIENVAGAPYLAAVGEAVPGAGKDRPVKFFRPNRWM